jgi:hypothetical protein
MARPKPLGDYLKPCLGRALAAHGFAAADVIVAWPEIVGDRLAPVSQPVKIEFPRGQRGSSEFDVLSGPEDRDRRPGATMVVRVEGAFAIELQHLAPVVIERINARYGWRFVGRLALRQGPVRRRPARSRVERTVGEADRLRIGEALAGVEDEALRAALDRLGSAVVGERSRAANDR